MAETYRAQIAGLPDAGFQTFGQWDESQSGVATLLDAGVGAWVEMSESSCSRAFNDFDVLEGLGVLNGQKAL